MGYIKTDAYSERLRRKGIDIDAQRVLISRLAGSDQEQDLTLPPNCQGLGRIRHFRRRASERWPENPLPIEPARRALGLESTDLVRAQVFQNAICNWRCWYCFVPFRLLEGSELHARWMSASDLLDLYAAEPDETRPPMIDLTGGQPDLVPEWVPWMMAEMRRRGLEQKVYLWSDDNLSNDYFWQHLTDDDRELIANYSGYGRVACFKGFDAESFSYNTSAAPELFDRQFQLFGKLLTAGVDLYAYTTFTTPNADSVREEMPRFVDRLQALDANLPLRTVPLEIAVLGVVRDRLPKLTKLSAPAEQAVENQYRAIEAWVRELDQRYSSEQRAASIVDVALGGS